jgi:hypothetical protein
MASASSFGKRYLSCKTQSSGQYRSLLICRSSPLLNTTKFGQYHVRWRIWTWGIPLRLKNSELNLPAKAIALGMSPISSIICATWSSSLLYRDPEAGSNR